MQVQVQTEQHTCARGQAKGEAEQVGPASLLELRKGLPERGNSCASPKTTAKLYVASHLGPSCRTWRGYGWAHACHLLPSLAKCWKIGLHHFGPFFAFFIMFFLLPRVGGKEWAARVTHARCLIKSLLDLVWTLSMDVGAL